MFWILSFVFGRFSNDNIDNLAKLLEVINDLLSNGIRIVIGDDFVNKNLIVMVVSANVNSIVTNFYCLEFAEFRRWIISLVPVWGSTSK